VDDLAWLDLACDLAALCPPSETAFSVGAVIVRDGRELARGFSRELDDKNHAEEAALAKLAGAELAGATVYSSLEPCAQRASRPKPCARLILDAGIRRVVFAWREPVLFVPGDGYELLTDHGVEVVELPELAEKAKRPNLHLL
jgi:diaminohydroxyphosphoribosylaminopyrimidine deaminase/5-amino-6-(5-phosphoribosylamino)uracil reductase